jgi:hypothetical protein
LGGCQWDGSLSLFDRLLDALTAISCAIWRIVSFTAVARKAAVSTDFLYKHPELRTLIELHRTKGGHVPGTRPAEAELSSTSAAVRALSARLAQQQQVHHEEVAKLREALAVAQGENLTLRRRLAQYEAD